MDISRLVQFDYDSKENILNISYPQGLVLDNETAIDQLCSYTLGVLTGIGQPVYILVDDTGVQFDLRMEGYYNQAFAPCLRYIRATTRYGGMDPSLRTLVSRRALLRRDPSNIYPNRDLALDALRSRIAHDQLRRHSPPLSSD